MSSAKGRARAWAIIRLLSPLVLCPRFYVSRSCRKRTVHDALGFVQDGAQMIFAAEAFGIDFVDALSPGRTRGEPSVLCNYL